MFNREQTVEHGWMEDMFKTEQNELCKSFKCYASRCQVLNTLVLSQLDTASFVVSLLGGTYCQCSMLFNQILKSLSKMSKTAFSIIVNYN